MSNLESILVLMAMVMLAALALLYGFFWVAQINGWDDER